MPWDFLLDKANLTPTELQDRFQCAGKHFLNKDGEECSLADTAGEGITPL